MFGPEVADFPGFGKVCGGGGGEPGAVFIDSNPEVKPEERFKLMVFGHRGDLLKVLKQVPE